MRNRLFVVMLLAVLLSACATTPAVSSVDTSEAASATLSAIVSATLSAVENEAPISTDTSLPPAEPTLPSVSQVENQAASQELTQIDEQGAVVVEVTPGNLDDPGEALTFDVALNTHSVDLSMDLTQLATLTTDTGLRASAVSWDGMAGGHHVSGVLSFPTKVDEESLLEGATTLTLVIQNVDAAERAFTWNLNP